MRKLIERTVRKNDIESVASIPRGVPFAAIDPGNHGAGIVFDQQGKVKKVLPFVAGDYSHFEFAQACVREGVRLLVIEDQYLGKSFSSSSTLGKSAGNVGGHLAALWLQQSDMNPVYRVWVHPTTWASAVFQCAPNTKRIMRQRYAKQLAAKNARLQQLFKTLPVKAHDGIADAHGIGCYWDPSVMLHAA